MVSRIHAFVYHSVLDWLCLQSWATILDHSSKAPCCLAYSVCRSSTVMPLDALYLFCGKVMGHFIRSIRLYRALDARLLEQAGMSTRVRVQSNLSVCICIPLLTHCLCAMSKEPTLAMSIVSQMRIQWRGSSAPYLPFSEVTIWIHHACV